jgi:hypothetical protein
VVNSPTTISTVRVWLLRLLIALLIGALAWGLAYLSVRAISTAYLFSQEQAFFQQAAGALQGGVAGLAAGNLREQRLRVEALQAEYHLLSATIGLGVGLVAAAAAFLRLERL